MLYQLSPALCNTISYQSCNKCFQAWSFELHMFGICILGIGDSAQTMLWHLAARWMSLMEVCSFRSVSPDLSAVRIVRRRDAGALPEVLDARHLHGACRALAHGQPRQHVLGLPPKQECRAARREVDRCRRACRRGGKASDGGPGPREAKRGSSSVRRGGTDGKGARAAGGETPCVAWPWAWPWPWAPWEWPPLQAPAHAIGKHKERVRAFC